MTPIAFDVATHTGYAYRVVGGWKHGVFDPRNITRLGEIIHEAIRAGCDVAVLEDNYLDRKTMNVRTVQVLQDCQSRIASECERRGLPWRQAAPVSWQAGWGIKGVRKERKSHAMLIARGLCPGDKLTQDEADAICMAEWWRLSKRDVIPLQARATAKKETVGKGNNYALPTMQRKPSDARHLPGDRVKRGARLYGLFDAGRHRRA